MVSGGAAFLALRTLPNAYDCAREVMKMGRKLTGCRISQICECGAVASEAAGVCEKCRFRVRWMRRKARRTFSAG
jgi:hypothetical protein